MAPRHADFMEWVMRTLSAGRDLTLTQQRGLEVLESEYLRPQVPRQGAA